MNPQLLYTVDDKKRVAAMVNFVPTFEPVEPQEVVFSDQAPESQFDDVKGSDFCFIFIIDRSGSMRGQRMKIACEALELFLQSLPEGSSFNVYSFGN